VSVARVERAGTLIAISVEHERYRLSSPATSLAHALPADVQLAKGTSVAALARETRIRVRTGR
jgi:hypothetical protein